MRTKVKTFEEIKSILEKYRSQGLKVVQCHGVFDLLHPGHIRHFREAKNQGDKLVVTVTPDRFVNKGPGRPAFNEHLRLETLSSLACVDYVVLNDTPDAVPAILRIKPDLYVKGKEYADASKDLTGKIVDEEKAVKEVGGDIFYTDDIVFSSSSLINRYVDPLSPELTKFLDEFKKRYSLEEVLEKIENLTNLKVLVIGDAILDEYQYVEPLGQAGKGQHMVANCLHKETFLGGSLIIANHVAQFSNNVTLLSSVGEDFSSDLLDKKVKKTFLSQTEVTLTKKRYVVKDGPTLLKIFETYSSNKPLLSEEETKKATNFIKTGANDFDLILVADFGNGFTNDRIINAISEVNPFLAINTQINSGNRGFNLVTHYQRADYISLNEPELRLAAHDRYSSLDGLAADMSEIMGCSNMAITRGVNGVFCFSTQNSSFSIPAITTSSIDRVGAGDSFLALSSLCMAKKYPFELSALIGAAAAAMSIQIIGNKECIEKAKLCKFLTRIFK